MKLSAWLEEHK